ETSLFQLIEFCSCRILLDKSAVVLPKNRVSVRDVSFLSLFYVSGYNIRTLFWSFKDFRVPTSSRRKPYPQVIEFAKFGGRQPLSVRPRLLELGSAPCLVLRRPPIDFHAGNQIGLLGVLVGRRFAFSPPALLSQMSQPL